MNSQNQIRAILAGLLASGAVALLAGCLPASGTVVGRSSSTDQGTGRTIYTLTVETLDGTRESGEVSESVWRACSKREAWPGCKR